MTLVVATSLSVKAGLLGMGKDRDHKMSSVVLGSGQMLNKWSPYFYYHQVGQAASRETGLRRFPFSFAA